MSSIDTNSFIQEFVSQMARQAGTQPSIQTGWWTAKSVSPQDGSPGALLSFIRTSMVETALSKPGCCMLEKITKSVSKTAGPEEGYCQQLADQSGMRLILVQKGGRPGQQALLVSANSAVVVDHHGYHYIFSLNREEFQKLENCISSQSNQDE